MCRNFSLVATLALAAGLWGGCRPDNDDVASKPSPPSADRAPSNPEPSEDLAASNALEQLDGLIGHFNRGVSLMDQYRPVDAIAEFEEVVRLRPDWLTGRLNLGIALLNAQGDEYYARAEEVLRAVMEADPENPRAFYSLGMLLRHLARFEEARQLFERVLELDPEDGDAHFQLGTLILADDPEAATTHLEQALEKIPHHESAAYRLQSLVSRNESSRSRELLLRFQALKKSGAGVHSGMKYGEMGRYADVVRRLDLEASPSPNAPFPLTYRDVAAELGLTASAGGRPGRPCEPVDDVLPSFGPGLALTDVDGDTDLDLLITAPDESVLCYELEAGRFVERSIEALEGTWANGAFFGDYDGDGDPDLFLTCSGPNRLFRNDQDWQFVEVTDSSGIAGTNEVSVGASWADADHDGDLDLFVAHFGRTEENAPHGAPDSLWRNNGDGTFSDVSVETGTDGGGSPSVSALFFDADDDRDLDLYVIDSDGSHRLYRNDRVGQYTEITQHFPELANPGFAIGALLGDVDGNGHDDLFLLRGSRPPRCVLQPARGQFVVDRHFEETASSLGGATSASLGDLDLDGDLDLVLLDAGPVGQPLTHRVLLNDGRGRFTLGPSLGEGGSIARARGAAAWDIDGDGMLEILVARVGAPPEIWKATAIPDRHWLEVCPRLDGGEKPWPEPTGVGLRVEVKTGREIQAGSVTPSHGYLTSLPPRKHFGLGNAATADYVRLTWPDAVLQSELEIASDHPWRVHKVSRKPSSCPVLFSWDGERFAFVTDFLGVGGLGFFVAPGEYAPPDPTEDVRIPSELIQPRNGRYLLRVAEPLEEVTYLDELHLIAYDHPEGWEVYPDERFSGSEPFATGEPHAVAQRIRPRRATTDRGSNVLERLEAIDRRYVEPPRDERFVGYAREHWLELDFGDQLASATSSDRIILYLYGWVEYTYSHVNYAAYQAGLSLRSPSLEVPTAEGGWRTSLAEMGFPAGLPRMMTVDISDAGVREQGRLRIRTNMEVFWDEAFVAIDVADATIRRHSLRPLSAELRLLGYPREYSPDGADPTLYDYDRVDPGLPFKSLAGDHTRFGDVRALLSQVDDRFVIMGRGEEIALEFEASALPPLAPGWSRTLVLHAEGYCKDMDLYTAFPDTVEPLPYRNMENYPPSQPLQRPHPLENSRRLGR